jgi:hypothetical protein
MDSGALTPAGGTSTDDVATLSLQGQTDFFALVHSVQRLFRLQIRHFLAGGKLAINDLRQCVGYSVGRNAADLRR